MLTEKLLNRLTIFGLLLIAAGCSDTGSSTETTGYDATAMLQNVGNNVILQTYINLDTEAGNLVTAAATLKDNPSQSSLEAAQKQWRNTREPWESSEGFIFGPVKVKGIDPDIDDWPLNKTDLDNVLNSNDELTEEYIGNLDTGLKGFHTIEYLLFGANNDKTINDFTDREFEYLIAATKRLKYNTDRLATAWSPEGDNYVSNIADAGNGSEVNPTQKKAVEQLITGVKGIADEVGNSKIGDPFAQKDPTIVESQFSFNSKTDFQNNIRSILHVYTGSYNGNDGPGVSDFVAELDTDLDARFKEEIDAAVTAIGNIKGNFRTAITENRSSIENAQQAVQTVLKTLQQDITPLLDQY